MNLKLSIRVFGLILCAGIVFYLLKPHHADDGALTGNFSKPLTEKQYSKALKEADEILRTHPQDADALLAKGIALTGLNQREEAIALYRKMTRNFPDLPEPYNNLAVLLAADGKHDQARQVLEDFLQSQGSYGVAYKNLGNVYAKLAEDAYSKALDIGQTGDSPSLQLNLLPSRAVTGQAPATIALSSIEPPKPVVVAKAPTPPKTVASAAVVEPTPTAAPEKPVSQTNPSAEREAIEAVQSWAAAWSKQDVPKYLAHYANNFDTGGVSRSAWENDRRARIAGKSHIEVGVSNFVVTFKNANTASVKFRQSYRSDRLSTQTTKTLVLDHQGTAWRIISERAGG